MKLKTLAVMVMSALALTACDDTTDTIGGSLTRTDDLLNVSTDTFNVSTSSFMCDSVLSNSMYGYLGKIVDPETGDEITADFAAKFHTLSDLDVWRDGTDTSTDSSGYYNSEYVALKTSSYILKVPKENGVIKADSTILTVFFTSFYGDSLAPMKVTAYEMDRPLDEATTYYSNFDPVKAGYIRKGGLKATKSYTLTDLSVSDSLRSDDDYVNNIRINLSQPYTDKKGNKYNNLGSYILQKFHEDSTALQNDYRFNTEVFPGLYLKHENGIGNMIKVLTAYLTVYYHYDVTRTYHYTHDSTKVDKTITYKSPVYNIFAVSPEVTQHTRISSSEKTSQLASDNSCTYLKTPAGIYTEVTLPIDEIMQGHENDTINSAKLTFSRINDTNSSKYNFGAPQYVLMVAKDSINTFFENRELPNSSTSFYTSYSSTQNGYVFNNISGLVSNLYHKKDVNNPNWNKVVLIPIEVTTNSSTSAVTEVTNTFTPYTTRLIGGTENQRSPIKLTVVYSKYNK